MKTEGREVAAMGGLHVTGTQRHEARRIDLQLRGRCGRQGDPGSSRFYLSLEDDLMRIFAGEWVKNILTRLGMEEGQAIESRMVSRRIEGRRKGRGTSLRDPQTPAGIRRSPRRTAQTHLLLPPADPRRGDCKTLILEMIRQQVDHFLEQFLAKDYGTETYAQWAGKQLGVEFEARDFRGMDQQAAENYAKEQAARLAEGEVIEAVEENLPEEVDPNEWNWEALAKTVNVRWRSNFRDRDLKKFGREGVNEVLIQKAHEAIDKVDLADGARYLDPDFGLRSACGWVKHKFGVELDWEAVRAMEPEAIEKMVRQKAEEAYREKEVEFPVMAMIARYQARDSSGHVHYDREKLAATRRPAVRRGPLDQGPEEQAAARDPGDARGAEPTGGGDRGADAGRGPAPLGSAVRRPGAQRPPFARQRAARIVVRLDGAKPRLQPFAGGDRPAHSPASSCG